MHTGAPQIKSAKEKACRRYDEHSTRIDKDSNYQGRNMAAKNAFYAQSGGVTAVINASAAGVIETARQHEEKIGTVYAGRNGIIGALTEDLIDTSQDSITAIKAL